MASKRLGGDSGRRRRARGGGGGGGAARAGAAGRPFLVAADDDGGVIGFARVSPYSVRKAYAGVGEHGVYVAAGARGRGVGKALLAALAEAAEAAGYHKLTSRVFTTNAASLALH